MTLQGSEILAEMKIDDQNLSVYLKDFRLYTSPIMYLCICCWSGFSTVMYSNKMLSDTVFSGGSSGAWQPILILFF